MADLDKHKVTVETLLESESFQNYVLKSNIRDIETWKKWLKDNPDQEGIVAEASLIIQQLSFRKEKVDGDTISSEWDALITRVDQDRERSQGRLISLYRGWQRIAAVLLIPVLIISGFLLVNLNRSEEGYSVIFSQHAHKNKVVLPDSSIAYLNTGSSIRYSGNYNRKEREVILTGEGYFDVVKNPKKPFSVIMDDKRITALGTRFTVRDYANEDFCWVILIEGKVACESPGIRDRIVLSGGEKLTYMKKTGKVILDRSDIGVETAWINDMLIIENDTFSTLIRKLENWYGVNITVTGKDSLIGSRYRLRLKTESLRESLDLINYIIPIDYEVDGDEVIVSVK